jgi:protein-L-isoaspartate O-methyltransferase
MELVLLACGLSATAIGTWRGYANARAVMAPLAHPGDATRTAIEATQPLAERARVRRMARNLAAAIAWLVLAMYGLFLIASAEAAR